MEGHSVKKIDKYSSAAEEQTYKFNGKEMDRETGLYYYGARYYDPSKSGVWYGIDPLTEKYPALSPYSYCAGNPVKYVDPDGRMPTEAEAAAMAAHVYGDKSDNILKGGWHVSNQEFKIDKNTDSGLNSQIYQRTTNGITEYAFVTAGSQNAKDWEQNIIQVIGLSTQYSESAEYANKLSIDLGQSTELTFVGHSLGGGLAATNSLVTDRNAITFNAARVTDATKIAIGGLGLLFKSEFKIKAIIMCTDPLNLAQIRFLSRPANGMLKILTPTDLNSAFNGHSMNNILKNYVDK